MSSFLFGLDFEVENTKVTLIRPELRRPFQFTFSSPVVLTYAVHFIGRAFICPGGSLCPACGTVSKRTLSLVAAGNEDNVALCEIGAQTLVELERIAATNNLENLHGSSWRFCRTIAKRPLAVEFVGLRPADQRQMITEHKFLLCFAKLFSLPRPTVGANQSLYAESIRTVLAEKLTRHLQI